MAQVLDNGYAITGIAGVEAISVDWAVGGFTEVTISYADGTEQSFDLDGFTDYADGVLEALKLARIVEQNRNQ